ncbi:MAG TPA: hypothetical protein VGK67_14515 [Myxococcales bacterium]|jgi:tetratricopeptide (TPR) repeat protein
MGRFFNREAAMVACGLLVAGVAVGLIAGLKPWLVVAVTVGIVAILHWPLTISFQSWVLEYYSEHQKLDRALQLAIEIRDSAMSRREREKAYLDVAFVHCARGDFEHALQNLNKIVSSSLKPVMRAVVEGSTAYTLAWLERDLPRADELAQRSAAAFPSEHLFGYFVGLVRFKQKRLSEAKDLIQKSLNEGPDLAEPYPGERPYVLAQVLKGLGEAEAAKAALEKARGTHGRFAELAAKELGVAAA